MAGRIVAKRQNWFAVALREILYSNRNGLRFTIMGKCLSYMRPGQGRNGHRFDQLRIERQSFRNAIINTFALVPLYLFGSEKVELEVTFTFTREYIPNDLDNLIKFVMDGLQDADIFDNDRQVVAIKAKKRTGHVAQTQIAVYRHFLVVDDDDDE